jgi:hypothetical protein
LGPVTVTAAFPPAGRPEISTARLPVVAAHETVNARVTVSEAATVTPRGFSPLTWQWGANPLSVTM